MKILKNKTLQYITINLIMKIKTLKDYYGSEDVYTTGCPKFSFFNKRSQIFNYYSYITGLDKNQIVTHTNFCRNNVKHDISVLSNQYILNVNNILNNKQHHLIHGITIYLFNSDISSIHNIQLKIGDVIFEYDLCTLSFIDKKYSPVFFKFEEKDCSYIKLPVELFEDTQTWINLTFDIPIELTINLYSQVKIRVDFLTITLDFEEERRYNINYSKQSYDCIIRHNNIMELNVKNMTIENKITFDLSNIKDGIKELSLFFKVNDNFVIDYEFVENIKLCVNETEITQDALQLLCSNKIDNNNKTRFIYEFPLSLFPKSFHPSGDFFVNDFNVSLIVSLGEIPKETLYDNMSLVLVINKMKLIRYYIDENNDCKCKWIHLEDAFGK
jgi:hypothetical protein